MCDDLGSSALFNKPAERHKAQNISTSMPKPQPDRNGVGYDLYEPKKVMPENKPEPATQSYSKETQGKSDMPYQYGWIKIQSSPRALSCLYLEGYAARSLNAVLALVAGDNRKHQYIASIANNRVCGGPFSKVLLRYDCQDFSLFQVTDCTETYMCKVDEFGVLSKVSGRVQIPRFIGEKFNFEGREWTVPDNQAKQVLERKGVNAVITVAGKRYLINTEFGTLIGFGLELASDAELTIKIGEDLKRVLTRVSPGLLLIRDIKTDREEVLDRISNMVIYREDVEIIGGCAFILPDERTPNVLTFVPQKLEFSSKALTKDKMHLAFDNGVFFLKEGLLFVDTGEYFLDVSPEQLDEGTGQFFIEDNTIYLRNWRDSID